MGGAATPFVAEVLRGLNAHVSEQPDATADQGDELTSPGQKEASGGLNEGSMIVEDTPTQAASPPAIQDLTVEE